MKTISLTIDEQSAGRVDLVVRQLSEASRSQVRGMVDHDCVSINGARCNSIAKIVSPGDVVSLCFDPAQRYREKKRKWDDRTFSIQFEDDHLIVVDKSAGTLTIPTDRDERNTLVERVGHYLSHGRGRRDAWLVHRLDRDVSGLLVFGKHEPIANLLIEQFKHRKPRRIYTAIVAGVMANGEGEFRSNISPDRRKPARNDQRKSRESEIAITRYRVLKRFSDTTLVEVELETGMRNQIRVQFANAGHPVLGDPRYRVKEATHPRWIRKRIALHATTLAFDHPLSGEAMTFESPLPAAMAKFVAGSR